MIKKSIAFAVIVLCVAVPFAVRLWTVLREDRVPLALCQAIASASATGNTAGLADILNHGASGTTLIKEYLEGDGSGRIAGQLMRCVNDDAWTESPLSWACKIPSPKPSGPAGGRRRFLSVARLLVAHGANVNVPAGDDYDDEYDLMDWAIGTEDPTLIRGMCAIGAQVTPDTFNTLDRENCANVATCREMARILVSAAGGRPPDDADNGSGETWVQDALESGTPAMVKALVEEGFAPDRSGSKESSIVLAIKNRRTDLIPLLIAHHADVNAYSVQYGETPLQAATLTGRWDVVQLVRRKWVAGAAHGGRAAAATASKARSGRPRSPGHSGDSTHD